MKKRELEMTFPTGLRISGSDNNKLADALENLSPEDRDKIPWLNKKPENKNIQRLEAIENVIDHIKVKVATHSLSKIKEKVRDIKTPEPKNTEIVESILELSVGDIEGLLSVWERWAKDPVRKNLYDMTNNCLRLLSEAIKKVDEEPDIISSTIPQAPVVANIPPQPEPPEPVVTVDEKDEEPTVTPDSTPEEPEAKNFDEMTLEEKKEYLENMRQEELMKNEVYKHLFERGDPSEDYFIEIIQNSIVQHRKFAEDEKDEKQKQHYNEIVKRSEEALTYINEINNKYNLELASLEEKREPETADTIETKNFDDMTFEENKEHLHTKMQEEVDKAFDIEFFKKQQQSENEEERNHATEYLSDPLSYNERWLKWGQENNNTKAITTATRRIEAVEEAYNRYSLELDALEKSNREAHGILDGIYSKITPKDLENALQGDEKKNKALFNLVDQDKFNFGDALKMIIQNYIYDKAGGQAGLAPKEIMKNANDGTGNYETPLTKAVEEALGKSTKQQEENESETKEEPDVIEPKAPDILEIDADSLVNEESEVEKLEKTYGEKKYQEILEELRSKFSTPPIPPKKLEKEAKRRYKEFLDSQKRRLSKKIGELKYRVARREKTRDEKKARIDRLNQRIEKLIEESKNEDVEVAQTKLKTYNEDLTLNESNLDSTRKDELVAQEELGHIEEKLKAL